jgi:hypothetical protein
MLRLLFPRVADVRDSRIAPREFEIRLRERVEPKHSPLSVWSNRYLSSRRPLYGWFKKYRFGLQKRSLFWIWSQPVAYGDMMPLPLGAGIRVHVMWRPHPLSRFAQWLGFTLFGVAIYFRLDPRLASVPLVVSLALPIAFRLELPGARRAFEESMLRPDS